MSLPRHCLFVGVFVLVSALLAPQEGSAQVVRWRPASPLDPEALPDAASPPSLPDLTHRGLWYGLETTFASIQPHDAITGPQPRSLAWSTRAEGEWVLSGRRWYAGVAHSLGYGNPPGGERGALLIGYPEIWGRAVWASRAGLAYGGGLSAVLPLFQRAPDSGEAIVAESVRVVRPWDFAPFAENTFSVQPYLDARIIDGRVTFQLRQGFVLQGLVAKARLPDLNVVSRTTLYLGYQPTYKVALGLEFQEVYFISTDFVADCQVRRAVCDDSLRAVFAISPSIRLLTRVFQPTLSAMFPFDRTLYDSVQSYWAIRLGLGAVYDE
ncbi:MAG: hypothetical protein RMJ98_13800 [Myxococcales bacterium]|nr:hypothetical protein [Polyangiaceae bacterium]MDW8250365.1 hypothetical protein [Myxococcales bacterium]